MIGGYDLFHQAADLVLRIRIGGIHEIVKLFEEGFHLEGDGAADVDHGVVGALQAFLGHELLLVELLAGAKAGIRDLDIHIRPEAGEADEVAGQCLDLDGAAHVEDEDLAAVGVGAREHDEADSLRDGHEVADDVRVGHGDGAALGDLLFEDRDDRPVGAQDIAEADSDKFGLHAVQLHFISVDPGQGFLLMGKELGDLGGAAGLDHGIEALDDHLAQALGGAHDVGGVDSLVRGDQDKALAAVDHGRVGGLVGADGVVFDSLAGAVLHEGHMLVGRGVVDDLRAVFVEDFEHPAAVADGPDQDLEIEVRVLFAELELDVVGVVLIDVKDDQLAGAVGSDLPAEFGADGAAAARDKDSPAVDEVIDFLHISFDGFAAEEVLHGDVLHGRDGDLAQDQLVHAGQVFELTVCLLTDIQDVAALRGAGAGDGEVDLFDLKFLDSLQDGVASADDGNVVDLPLPLVGVVVDDADDALPDLRGLVDVAQDHAAGGARPDQHDTLNRPLLLSAAGIPHEENKPVGKTDADYKQKLENAAEYKVSDRHAAEKHGDSEQVDARRQNRSDERPHQLRIAGKPPDAAIQVEPPENDQTQHRVGRGKAQKRPQIISRDLREPAVEA